VSWRGAPARGQKQEKIRLVIPRQHHTSGFSPAQQAWLMSVSDFLDEIRTKEVEIAGMSVM
jgi:hypothetical protein